jgi:hypothetical protein
MGLLRGRTYSPRGTPRRVVQAEEDLYFAGGFLPRRSRASSSRSRYGSVKFDLHESGFGAKDLEMTSVRVAAHELPESVIDAQHPDSA